MLFTPSTKEMEKRSIPLLLDLPPFKWFLELKISKNEYFGSSSTTRKYIDLIFRVTQEGLSIFENSNH